MIKNKLSVSLFLIISVIFSTLLFSYPVPISAVIVNGVDNNPPPNNTTTTSTTTTTITPGTTTTVTVTNNSTPYSNAVIKPVTPTYVNGRWSENSLRQQFTQYGIKANGNVTLYGLGNFAITGIVSLKKTLDYYTLGVRSSSLPIYDIVIRAGTETYGLDNPVLDINTDPNLDYFIPRLATSRGQTSMGALYQLGDDYFFQGNGYWHIIFGPSNGAFVKNAVNFFGIVRDSFNVAHPAITPSNTPSTIAFNRNLTVGSKGQDVFALQQLLNTDPYTVIASSGPGSPGQETQNFGSLTEKAVERYQYKNNEILDAAAITAPTGFVGSFSRASFSAYGNYLNAMKNAGNQIAVQYSTPTKPLENIPLNLTITQTPQTITVTTPPITATVGTPGATTTLTTINPNPGAGQIPVGSIGVNTTPNAPPYPGGDQFPDQLNNTPVFDDPYNNGIVDPNNSANSTSNSPQQSTQPSLLQQLLPTILQVAPRLLNGGLPGTSPNTSAPSSALVPIFGGYTLYNSTSPWRAEDKYRPCGCSPEVAYVMNDNSRSTTHVPSPVVLLQPISVTPPLVETQCALGKYVRLAGSGSCRSWVPTNGTDVCTPGIGIEKFPPINGQVIIVNSQANACSGS